MYQTQKSAHLYETGQPFGKHIPKVRKSLEEIICLNQFDIEATFATSSGSTPKRYLRMSIC
jgi:hypothetical protein